MSRSKRYIEIEGILALDVLSTFTIIRGFAISETPAMRSGLGLIERLTAFCCKYLMISGFLFE